MKSITREIQPKLPRTQTTQKRGLQLICAVALLWPAQAWATTLFIAQNNRVTGHVNSGSYDHSSNSGPVSDQLQGIGLFGAHVESNADALNLYAAGSGLDSGFASAELHTLFNFSDPATPLELSGYADMYWQSSTIENSHGTSSFLLTDLTTSQVIDTLKIGETFDPQSPGFASFARTYTLLGGHTYQLDATVTTITGFGETSQAGLNANVLIPLPNAALMGLTGLVLLAILPWSRKSSTRSTP